MWLMTQLFNKHQVAIIEAQRRSINTATVTQPILICHTYFTKRRIHMQDNLKVLIKRNVTQFCEKVQSAEFSCEILPLTTAHHPQLFKKKFPARPGRPSASNYLRSASSSKTCYIIHARDNTGLQIKPEKRRNVTRFLVC